MENYMEKYMNTPTAIHLDYTSHHVLHFTAETVYYHISLH